MAAGEDLRWLRASWLESRQRCCFGFLELDLSLESDLPLPRLLEFFRGGGVNFPEGDTGLSLETSCRTARCTMSRTDYSKQTNLLSRQNALQKTLQASTSSVPQHELLNG